MSCVHIFRTKCSTAIEVRYDTASTAWEPSHSAIFWLLSEDSGRGWGVSRGICHIYFVGVQVKLAARPPCLHHRRPPCWWVCFRILSGSC